MSRLRESLQRLRKIGGEDGRERVEHRASVASARSEWDALCAHIHSGSSGSFVRRVCHYSLDHHHGNYALSELDDHVAGLSRLSGSHMPDSGTMLFLDTETTGLGIGTGNVAFMIGLGYQAGGRFVVDQLLIRNPAEEQAMLEYLSELLPRFRYLVTYNGKSFDWPLIRTRYQMHKQELDDGHLFHLDVLHPSRSLWKHTLPTCKLSTVEERKLGVYREADLPGSLAPAMYFQYLAEGDPQILDSVFRHNASDLLTLQVLCSHIAKLLQGHLRFEELESGELLRAGVWLDKLGACELADVAFRQLRERPTSELRGMHQDLAAVYKRRGDWEAACKLWEASLEAGGTSLAMAESCIELSMICEHKWKDYGKALLYAMRASDYTHRLLAMSRDAKYRRLLLELQKRIGRLHKKQKVV